MTILNLIHRHTELQHGLDRYGDKMSDAERGAYRRINQASLDLEPQIMLAPATTIAELRAKWAFIIEYDLIDECASTLNRIIREVLQRDVDRVGTTICELAAEGIRPRLVASAEAG